MNETAGDITRYAHPEGGVVVGDDGSDGAEHAVAFALEEARRRGVTLHVVRAWSIMHTPRPANVPLGIAASLGEYEAQVREEEARRLKRLLGDDPGVALEVHFVHSPAAQALIVASETADILVLGTRGLGGFRALVLGSVAEQCIRHAHGPVIVVREPR